MLLARMMLCDGHFPQKRSFQAYVRIQVCIWNEKSCCRAQCNALTQQQELLLTRAFNKQLQTKRLEGLRRQKRLGTPGCSRSVNAQHGASYPRLPATKIHRTLAQSTSHGFFSPPSFLWRKVKVSPVPTDAFLPSQVRGGCTFLGAANQGG